MQDDFDKQIEAFEVPAKRFGSFKADLSVKSLPTGFTGFTRYKLLREVRPDLCVIGARPGNGKTSFLVQVLRTIAREKGHTMMFSLEMAADQLMQRALASEAGVAMDNLEKLSPNRLAAIEASIDKENFYVDDSNSLDINTIRARAIDYNKRNRLSAIGVDYLQIVKAEGFSKRDQVGKVAEGLKQLAKDLGAPVIALAQMSREIEKRQQMSKSARPVMSDLQECSLVENWADQIVFLDGAAKRDPARVGEIDVYIAKNRHGPAGDFILAFDGEKMKFTDFIKTEGI